MKLTAEDPILTAYILGEIDESSRILVEAALAKDQSLAREEASLSALARLMSETLQSEPLSLGGARQDEILKAGRIPDAELLVLDHHRKSRRQSFLAVVGVAAVVVIGFVGLSKLGTNGLTHPSVVSSPGEAAAPATEEMGEGGLGNLSGMSIQTSLGSHTKILPSLGQTLDASFIEKSLTQEGSLPAREYFQIAPWVNALTASSEPELVISNIAVYAELGPCLWNEEKRLLLVNIRPLDGESTRLKATLNFNPERVRSASLLGEELGVQVRPVGEVPLIENECTLLYELDTLSGELAVGSIDLEVGDEERAYLPLRSTPHELESLSDDFLTAVTFAEFARWGSSEAREPEELTKLASRARALLTSVTHEKLRYLLDMILLSEESLKR